jgi:uncharacterized protein (TIGR04255 family)
MASFIKLKNTPIKEIVFTISFNETILLETLDRFKELPKIVEKFAIVNQGFNMNIEAIGNEQPVSKALLDGYVLKCIPLSRIIQARRGSFSFHKVNGYEAFETLIAEFREYWNLLIRVAGNLTVNNLSVRYLNFIAETAGENTSELISIRTTHPFGEHIESYFTQYRFKYDRNPEISVNIISAKGKDGIIDGSVLDIILNKQIGNEQNSQLVFDTLSGMRQAKNDLFFRSITEKAIQKFNQ